MDMTKPNSNVPEFLAPLPFRKGVGIMLLDKQNRVFVARRIDMTSEAWQMPQGGMDKNEQPIESAMRELKEEIGTNNAKLIYESPDWYYYDFPEWLAKKLWGGRFRGQRQKWFLMQLDCEDCDINLDTDHPEFCEWKWVEAEELPNLIVEFKRDLYRAVLKQFLPQFPKR